MATCSHKAYKTLALVGLIIAAILLISSFLLAFLWSPLVKGVPLAQSASIGGELVSNKLLFSQKIFFFHVPVAISSFVLLGFGAYFGLRFLLTKDKDRQQNYDLKAQASIWAALVFIIMTMVSGVPWTRFEWGVWWVWEPRLTTYFILMLLVITYWVLRMALSESHKQARLCAAFSILMFLDAPLSFMITRLTPSSIHPVVIKSQSSLPSEILVPFVMAIIGMFLVAYALSYLRYQVLCQEHALMKLKYRLDSLRKA